MKIVCDILYSTYVSISNRFSHGLFRPKGKMKRKKEKKGKGVHLQLDSALSLFDGNIIRRRDGIELV